MNPKRAVVLIPALISLLTVVGNTVKMLIDGNPETNPDWNMAIATATAAFAVIFTRPLKMSSEEAGAK